MVTLQKEKSQENFIDMDNIRSIIKISNVNLFPFYLLEIYKDLKERNESNKKKGIGKIIFYEYIKLPIFVSDKLFDALDLNKDGYLDKNEFINGLFDLYYGSLEKNLEIIFRIYDFDKDEKINKKDITQLLSYLPLKNESKQVESVKELEFLVSDLFINEHITKDDFFKIIKLKSSEIFLDLYCYLISNYPFSINSIENFKNHPKIQEQDLKIESYDKEYISTPKKTPIESPEFVSKIEPLELDLIIPKNNTKKHHERRDDIKIEKDSYCKRDSKLDATPSVFLKKDRYLEEQLDNEIKERGGKRKSSLNTPQIIKSAKIYKITENNNIKSYFLKLFNKDIIYYKNEKCEEIVGMHNLSGAYVNEKMNDKSKIVFEDKTYYSFSIVFSNKTRTYFCEKQEDALDWIKKLKDAIGYENFLDHYEFTDVNLGNGKFGIVKLGIHLKTKEKVAIKIIKKADMDVKDIELVKSEIDIMIMCRHRNIVRLLDKFENKDYYYIVMEYLKGDTFASYLEKTPIDALSEEQCCKIIYQICKALEYLHDFGIVHRDLKPENIMIKTVLPYDANDSIKIMDFGLSKILGSSETVTDGFGTLTYVAPEVLKREPYNKSVDIWSLGIIVYYTVCGEFPFDDKNNNESNIAKKIVSDEIKFSSKHWSGKSKELIDFIVKATTKNISKRPSIKTLLNHEWFKKTLKGKF